MKPAYSKSQPQCELHLAVGPLRGGDGADAAHANSGGWHSELRVIRCVEQLPAKIQVAVLAEDEFPAHQRVKVD